MAYPFAKNVSASDLGTSVGIVRGESCDERTAKQYLRQTSTIPVGLSTRQGVGSNEDEEIPTKTHSRSNAQRMGRTTVRKPAPSVPRQPELDDVFESNFSSGRSNGQLVAAPSVRDQCSRCCAFGEHWLEGSSAGGATNDLRLPHLFILVLLLAAQVCKATHPPLAWHMRGTLHRGATSEYETGY